MEKIIDVTALGELLIDFTSHGESEQGNALFEANPGGAPCNVLSMLNNYGRKTAFIGKVGDDMFGNKLKDTLDEIGISTENLLLDPEVPTTLAFVKTFEDGDRDFSFYRNPGADVMLTPAEVSEVLIEKSKVFHFGSLSLTHKDVRSATKLALEYAKKHECIVTYDPNLREPLWKSLDDAKEQIAWGMKFADVMKISDNEIQWFTGEEDFDKGAEILLKEYDIKLLLVTLGKDGSKAYFNGHIFEQAGFINKNTIETTGAGDTFCATVIEYVLKYGLEEDMEEHIDELLRTANAAASIITTRKGALRVMPTINEIEMLLKK